MKKDGVVVRFLLGAQDTLDTVENVDAHIYLADGSQRHATFFTTKAIDELLRKNVRTGEAGRGSYFWCSDQVIVPAPGMKGMMAAIMWMIRSGEIEVMCSLIEDGHDPAC